MSIQSHDITRQQLEHVTGALQGILSTTPDGGITSSAAALVRLQRAQLQSAAAAFARSTNKIDSDLEGIDATVGVMAEISNGIQGPVHHQRDGFLSAMQHRFAAIALVVGELDLLRRATRTSVAGLTGTSQDLGAALTEVRSIESELNHISINAILSANHIGSRGNALVVIAEAIRDLRAESASRSDDATAVLDSIEKAIASLLRHDVSDDSAGKLLLEALNLRVRDLQFASESSASAAVNVAAQADSLSAKLRGTRNSFAIGALFAETITRCAGVLDDVASEAAPSTSDEAVLEASAVHYSMETERSVHRAAVREASSNVQEERDSDTSEECGEDVEFFDERQAISLGRLSRRN